MRQKLKKIGNDERHTFIGTFDRYGIKSYGNTYSPTFLITDVKIIEEDGSLREVTDHLWLNLTKGFAELGSLFDGDVIQFDGRVSRYKKGYYHDEYDFKISYPTNILLKKEVDGMPRIEIPVDDKHALTFYAMKRSGNMTKYDYSFYQKKYFDWEKKQKEEKE